MLAPIFKRINREGQRESEFRELWLPRSERILETLVATGSSIVCLQECWLSHPEWVRLFDSALGAAGYRTLKLPRTNNRGDGLMIAVKNEQWRVVDYQQLLFHDCGDRVAQIVRLRSKGRLGGKKEGEEGGQEEQQEEEEDLLVVNTHLLFPHDANSNIIRLCQVYKLLERVEQCRSEQSGRPAPVILCGDLNGTKEGNVYKLLRSQGFLSSYDTAHHLNDVDEKVDDVDEKVADVDEKWVSHRSHRGDVCGVDYVWMLNASTPMSNPVLNWRKAVFGLIKSKLLAAGITDARHAFQFFATAGDTSPYEHTVCFTDPNATGAVDISVDYGRQQGDTNAIEKSESESESGEEEDEEAWRFYDSDEEGRERQECCITAFTIEDFQLAVAQLGLTGDNSIGLTEVEVMELMQGADTDGDGWVDFNEFQDMFQQPTWDSRVDTLKQSMAASLAASLAATSATSSAPASASGSASAAAASVASATAAATAATVTSASRTSSSAPLSSSSVSSRNLSGSVQQESQQQQRWEEKEQAVLQGEQPYWESRRGLNVEGEAAQRSNHCRDGSSSAGADADADATRASGGEEMERVGSGSHFFGTNAGGSVPEGLGAVEECEIEPSNRGLSLSVLKASLFPPEMEEGRWPEEYTLSDHAVLTVMFGREREEVRE
ncbi:hypothetical protein CLOP_g23386 [Closterium sp. NIES-67]|nr:hypothetical protein CLOP_g23386 [Closterium sp. NIES-67]